MSFFKQQYDAFQAAVDAALPDYLPEQAELADGKVVEAARYSLLGGGKRIRPVLLLATAEMLGVNRSVALPFAVALEMIHTYSLIHDDLPCMDDDDLRRGRPTCHKVYSEALAVLAGDALLNRAYEILLDAIRPEIPGSVEAARRIASAAGSRGMIGGQSLDLAAAGQTITLPELRILHQLKTGALLKAPVLAAAALAGVDQEMTELLTEYAVALGLAFQIQDDILDTTSDAGTLGKTVGKDARDKKPTYVSLLGTSSAKVHLDDSISLAASTLHAMHLAGLKTHFLEGLTAYVRLRTH